jgi:hypothetical protein
MTRLLRLGCAMACLLTACADPAEPAPAGPAENALFVSVQIPEPLIPLQRVARFENPLEAALKRQRLGEVTGGGSQLGPRRPDGKYQILGVDLDVELSDAARGLPALRAALRDLKAPPGTVLVYESGGQSVKESLW